MEVLRIWIITCERFEMLMIEFLFPIWILNRKKDADTALCLYGRKSFKFARIINQFQKMG